MFSRLKPVSARQTHACDMKGSVSRAALPQLKRKEKKSFAVVSVSCSLYNAREIINFLQHEFPS